MEATESPLQAPRHLRVALRFSLRRSHFLIASNRQVVYGLSLFRQFILASLFVRSPLHHPNFTRRIVYAIDFHKW